MIYYSRLVNRSFYSFATMTTANEKQHFFNVTVDGVAYASGYVERLDKTTGVYSIRVGASRVDSIDTDWRCRSDIVSKRPGLSQRFKRSFTTLLGLSKTTSVVIQRKD